MISVSLRFCLFSALTVACSGKPSTPLQVSTPSAATYSTPTAAPTQDADAVAQDPSPTNQAQTPAAPATQSPVASAPASPAAPAPTQSTQPQTDSTKWSKADLTNYESYPAPGSAECVEFNGCTWEGQFAALPDKMPESWVKEHNIIAIHSKDFSKYKLKTLRLRQGTHTIDATVYDECADSDCDGCCTENSKKTGFLIDIEKYTSEKFGGSDGIVEWQCLDCK